MGKSLKKTLLEVDQFGHTANLYYENDNIKKHSYCGVCMTLLLLFIGLFEAVQLGHRVGTTE